MAHINLFLCLSLTKKKKTKQKNALAAEQKQMHSKEICHLFLYCTSLNSLHLDIYRVELNTIEDVTIVPFPCNRQSPKTGQYALTLIREKEMDRQIDWHSEKGRPRLSLS